MSPQTQLIFWQVQVHQHSTSIPHQPSTFELGVTSWAYGVQIDAVHLSKGEKLIKISNFERNIEALGDSLSSGDFATFEGLSSYAYGLTAGLGNTEYSTTVYQYDEVCWGIQDACSISGELSVGASRTLSPK